jgi:hypothetical protein
MQALQKWHPYNRAMHSSTGFSPCKVCIGFLSLVPTEMPLSLAPSISTHQHREQQDDHSGIHHLSQQHTPVAVALQVTPDRSKQHHASYLVDKQCQTPTGQVDDSRDIVQRKFPQWWKQGRFQI